MADAVILDPNVRLHEITGLSQPTVEDMAVARVLTRQGAAFARWDEACQETIQLYLSFFSYTGTNLLPTDTEELAWVYRPQVLWPSKEIAFITDLRAAIAQAREMPQVYESLKDYIQLYWEVYLTEGGFSTEHDDGGVNPKLSMDGRDLTTDTFAVGHNHSAYGTSAIYRQILVLLNQIMAAESGNSNYDSGLVSPGLRMLSYPIVKTHVILEYLLNEAAAFVPGDLLSASEKAEISDAALLLMENT